MNEQGRITVLFRCIWVVSALALLMALISPGLAFGRLPGDFMIERGPLPIHLPIASAMLVSAAVAGLFFVLSHLISRR